MTTSIGYSKPFSPGWVRGFEAEIVLAGRTSVDDVLVGQ